MLGVRRIGNTTSRVTHGDFYPFVETTRGPFSILDNQGNPMRPCAPTIEGLENRFWNCEDSEGTKKPTPTNQKEASIMTSKLTIKATTLINGRDSDFLDLDTIIAYIEQETAHLNRLEKLAITSKAITQLQRYHNNNIAKLVETLDARDPEPLTD